MRYDSLQKLLNGKILDMENKFKELKEKTLWKIDDCNELLKNRVSE